MRTDRQKDRWREMATIIIAFRNFADAPKIVLNDTLVVVPPNDSFDIKPKNVESSDSYVD